MKNLLFVSIAFPPKNDPECLQSARYFKYLKETKKFNIDVVTSGSPTLFMPHDQSLMRYEGGYRQLVEVQLFENKIVSFVLRKLGLGLLLFPDSKMTFHWQWKKVVRQIKKKPAIIYSRSKPMSSAFLAMKLKLHYKCTWIMHFSDPWAVTPLDEIPTSQLNKYQTAEKEFLEMADAITFTTPQTQALYANKYPHVSSKFSVFPNVYDPDDIRETPMIVNDKLRIVYTGGLTGKRNVNFLLPILNLICIKNALLLEKLEFIFAGPLDRPNSLFFKNPLFPIRHVGYLNQEEVKKLCVSAQILLVVDNPTEMKGGVFFPSKILDYFLCQRKIWAVTPQESATRDVLTGYSHQAFEHTEILAMADFLMTNIDEYTKKGNVSFQCSEIPDKYNARPNAKALSELILNLAPD